MWIKTSEQLPELNQWCFFWYNGSMPIVGNYKGDGKFLCTQDNEYWIVTDDYITYWMACPDSPK